MTSFKWDNEKLKLEVTGVGTLSKQDQYTDARHITVIEFTEIGNECFFNYHELLTVTLPDSIVSIGNNIFQNTKVKEIHLPKNVQYLSDGQSFDCQFYLANVTVDPENPYFCDVKGVLYSKNMTVLHFYPGNRPETKCIVPKGVVTIKVGAFSDSYIRKEIDIPASVKNIEWAFGFNSFALEKVTIHQCPQLVKIDKELLFTGTSKTEDIIQYKYGYCGETKQKIFQNNQFIPINTFILVIPLVA